LRGSISTETVKNAQSLISHAQTLRTRSLQILGSGLSGVLLDNGSGGSVAGLSGILLDNRGGSGVAGLGGVGNGGVLLDNRGSGGVLRGRDHRFITFFLFTEGFKDFVHDIAELRSGFGGGLLGGLGGLRGRGLERTIIVIIVGQSGLNLFGEVNHGGRRILTIAKDGRGRAGESHKDEEADKSEFLHGFGD